MDGNSSHVVCHAEEAFPVVLQLEAAFVIVKQPAKDAVSLNTPLIDEPGPQGHRF